MRLKLTLGDQSGIIIPWCYQYAIKQCIYQTISKADDNLATILHDHGYAYEGKSLKLFSFGPWSSFPFKPIPGQGIKFSSSTSPYQPSTLSTINPIIFTNLSDYILHILK
ncbi:MAG: hypothetical protein IPM42_12245 [Saprospiraceae bacterium]|nr:hypothetical protein [Saprospiraceae bacterium]